MSYTVICEVSSGYSSSAPRLSVITFVDPPESRSEALNAGDFSELLCERVLRAFLLSGTTVGCTTVGGR
jgi:hypothetical protein